jgi:transposase
VRVTTAFNRVMNLPGAWVASVAFTDAGIVVGLRRRGTWLSCPCGWHTRFRYDSSRRRWRHRDFGACKVFLEADLHRVDCRACLRVRTEQIPWARPGARHTRDFEDVAGWLAQRLDKTSVAGLLRCSWEAVDHIVARVVADHIDDARLDGLYRIGVDEISYKRGHRYLTIMADNDTGRVVWVGKDRSQAAFNAFFDALGQRAEKVAAISLDASSIYKTVAADRIPQATICRDPFHVIRWAGEVVDAAYRAEAPRFPVGDGRPSGGTGAVRATPSAPAKSGSTSATTRFSGRCAGTATGCGAAGNSRNNCVTCTGSSTRPTPPATSSSGAPPRYAAASPPTKPWSGASANTST